MSRRTRYQQGSVQREKRKSGSDVWVFRWWESTADGGTKTEEGNGWDSPSIADRNIRSQSS